MSEELSPELRHDLFELLADILRPERDSGSVVLGSESGDFFEVGDLVRKCVFEGAFRACFYDNTHDIYEDFKRHYPALVGATSSSESPCSFSARTLRRSSSRVGSLSS